MSKQQRSGQGGFTLIELSIVLVVIGLIVGGILIGQNLIKGAQLRSTLTEIGKLNSSVNTFRDKFGGYPGDFTNYTNVGMGVPSAATGVAAANGVGNGLIEDKNYSGILYDGEIGTFFYDLSQAQMLDNNTMVQNFDDTTPAITTIMMATPLPGNISLWAAAGKGTLTGLPSSAKLDNFWRLGQVTAIATGAITDGLGITPVDAAALDSKLDDGNGATGNVLSYNSGSGDMALTTGAGKCILASGAYDVLAHPNTGECSLAIKANF